jgi:hypothetical protein
VGSVNDRTITWNWTAPDGNGRPIDHYEVWIDGDAAQNTTATSYQRTFAYSETKTLNVIAVNSAGLKSAPGRGSARTVDQPPPPTTVSISKGAKYTGTQCSDPSCAWINVAARGFAAGGSYSLQCWSTLDSQPFWTQTVRMDGAGNYSAAPCFYGYSGRDVWVVVGGVSSPRMRW